MLSVGVGWIAGPSRADHRGRLGELARDQRRDGAQKLLGAFGGPGIDGMAGFNAHLGIPFPELSAYLAAGAEVFGGLALAAGVFSRLASMLDRADVHVRAIAG